MKILVVSDSHGKVDNMRRCVEMVNPRHVLHLGDCIRDAEELQRLFPDIQGHPAAEDNRRYCR